jgi:predicted glycosyltransferase
MFGFSAINICLLGRLFKIRTILFADTEDAGWISKLTFPYASKIIIPETFKRSFPKREIRFKGTHELSYLMDFNPNNSTLNLLGREKYVILRFVSWQASHDIKESGLSYTQKKRLISLLEKDFKVFISSEKPLPKELRKYKLRIPPHKIHDAMYFAEMFIGESQSMATEAGLLGTPSIRYNSLVGKMHGLGQYTELQEKGLVFSINNEEEFFNKVVQIMKIKNRKQIWRKRRSTYLRDKINPAGIALREILKNKQNF